MLFFFSGKKFQTYRKVVRIKLVHRIPAYSVLDVPVSILFYLPYSPPVCMRVLVHRYVYMHIICF